MRELELIYKLYEDELSKVEVDEEFRLDEELKDKLFKCFQTEQLQVPQERKEIGIGNVYLMFKGENATIVYYLIYDKIDGLYEVINVSKWWQLGAQNDMLVKINNELYIVEYWNKFYLTEEEVKNSVYISRLNDEDMKLLKEQLEKGAKLPKDKRVLDVDLTDEKKVLNFQRTEESWIWI